MLIKSIDNLMRHDKFKLRMQNLSIGEYRVINASQSVAISRCMRGYKIMRFIRIGVESFVIQLSNVLGCI